MDGLQVANAAQEKQAVPSRETDKFPLAHTQAYPPSTANSQPVAPSYQQQQAPPPQPYHDEKPLPPDARYRIPFGLSVIAYSILVAAIVLIICSAGFGGALGTVAASKGKDCSAADSTQPSAATTTTVFSTVTATSVPTSTPSTVASVVADYVPLAPSEISTAGLNCTTGSSMFTPSGSQFQLNCNTNYPGNDIFLVTTYRLEDCIGACANLNTLTSSTTCRGVLFNANMQAVVAQNGGNCWLKSTMESPGPDGLPPSVGAILVATS